MEETKVAEEVKVRPTRYTESVLKLIDRMYYPQVFCAFDHYDLLEIREQCLTKLETLGFMKITDPNWCDWMQPRIMTLAEQNDLLWERLLSCFISNSAGGNASRSLEFAISLVKKNRMTLVRKISKLVYKRLQELPELYWHTPSLNWFLNFSLHALDPIMPKGKNEYREDDWAVVERAIKAIVREQDISFLPQVKELYRQHRDKQIFFNDRVVNSQNQLALKLRLNELEKEARKQQPDVGKVLGEYFFSQTPLLKTEISVRVRHPQSMLAGPQSDAFVNVDFDIPFDLMQSIRTKLESDYFDPSVIRPGMNRFWLTFLSYDPDPEKQKEIAQTAIYIYGE
jgi:hypothetical protein